MIYTSIRILHIHTYVQQERSRKAFLEHCSRPQGRIIACQPQASAVEGEPAPRSVGSFGESASHGQSWPVGQVRRATLESIGALLLQEATMMDHMEDHSHQPWALGLCDCEGKRYLLPQEIVIPKLQLGVVEKRFPCDSCRQDT